MDAVNIRDNRVDFAYTVRGRAARYFNPQIPFIIEYSENISDVPASIAVIPFVCNVLPIAWVTDTEIIVSELDRDFYEHVAEIKQGYIDMYPRVEFGGKLTVGKLVDNSYTVSNTTAAFFSGGVDSFATLITHAEEHPALITLWGSDVRLSDGDGWERVRKHVVDTGKQFNCATLFIKSAFRLFLNEGALSDLVMSRANDGWWHGFQHGIGIISHVAPYSYLHKLAKIYFASSFSSEYTATCASDPSIDNHLRIGSCATIHDRFDLNRQAKIHLICEYKRKTSAQINLRVCWESDGGGNCCNCEKCYRTICAILAEGENPAEMGFQYSIDRLKAALHNPKFIDSIGGHVTHWRGIQKRCRENPGNLRDDIQNLLIGIDFNDTE